MTVFMEQEAHPQQAPNLPVSFKKKNLFIWLHQVLVVAQRIFNPHCGMQIPWL